MSIEKSIEIGPIERQEIDQPDQKCDTNPDSKKFPELRRFVVVVAEFVAVSVRPEKKLSDHTLIATCQKWLCDQSAECMTPQELINANRAFAELLSRYHLWIWSQIHSRPTLDSQAAYSAALEGFQVAITSFDLSTGFALASLASICVRNALQGLLRKEQRQAAKIKQAAIHSVGVHEDNCVDPFEQEQFYQTVQRLDQAISSLGEATQQIVSMRGQGLKFSEIGQQLDKSSDAVRMAHRRAIIALRSILEKQPQPCLSALREII